MTRLILIITSILLTTFILRAQDEKLPQNWYHLDPTNDNYNGVSEIRAYKELLKGKSSKTTIVAVIDSGVDIEHEDLRNVIWTNKDEIPNNGIDDDKNGYIDDVNGWNFIGGKDGRNINGETLEITRLYKDLKKKYEGSDTLKLNKKGRKAYAKYSAYKKTIDDELMSASNQLENISKTEERLLGYIKTIQKEIPGKKLNQIALDTTKSEDEEYLQAAQVGSKFLSEWGDNITYKQLNKEIKGAFKEARDYYGDKIKYNYNVSYNGRAEIVKDDQNNDKEKYYGNNNAEGPDALHGTHVAGIIGAERGNKIGMDGIANNVEIMSIRAVPNGDERDKDVANAIRYAVDNGATIINMSFGKGHSANKRIVDKAVRYAEKKDVLLIHAAGNSSQNNDTANNYPNDKYEKRRLFFWKKKRAKNWLEIGALNFEKDQKLVAGFSNYGQDNVDVFAPGTEIYSTIPNNEYKFLQGTSMAAPVVAGIAAVLRSYFPEFSAKEIKEIIMESSIKMNDEVIIPGSEGVTTTFDKLSISGGIANMYNAVKLAIAKQKK